MPKYPCISRAATGAVALILAAAALLGSSTGMGRPVWAPLRSFQCYEMRSPGAFDRMGLTIEDRFGSTPLDVHDAFALCAPADVKDEDPSAPDDPGYLASYGVMRAGRFVPVRKQLVVNEFGTLTVDVVKPARLLVPSAKSLVGPPASLDQPQLDHFQCYKVKRGRGAASFVRVSGVAIRTQFETATIDLVRPLRLCAPADENGESPDAEDHAPHLLCYRAKGTPGLSPTSVFVNNQFGQQRYAVRQRRELCVPSLTNVTATSTSTSTTTTMPEISCGPAAWPTCDGTCPTGYGCAVRCPFFECSCYCVSLCDGAEAPACGAPCPDPGYECVQLRGQSSCTCAQPGSCYLDAPPACGGTCPDGSTCGEWSGHDTCICAPPGYCEISQAPACGGTCPFDGEICGQLSGTNSCECRDPDATCLFSDAPACGGKCPTGQVCGQLTGGGPCICAQSTCLISQVPACGGTCPNGEVCRIRQDGTECECNTPSG